MSETKKNDQETIVRSEKLEKDIDYCFKFLKENSFEELNRTISNDPEDIDSYINEIPRVLWVLLFSTYYHFEEFTGAVASDEYQKKRLLELKELIKEKLPSLVDGDHLRDSERAIYSKLFGKTEDDIEQSVADMACRPINRIISMSSWEVMSGVINPHVRMIFTNSTETEVMFDTTMHVGQIFEVALSLISIVNGQVSQMEHFKKLGVPFDGIDSLRDIFASKGSILETNLNKIASFLFDEKSEPST